MSSSWLMFFQQPGCQSSNLRFGHLPTRGCKVQRNKAATLEAGHVGWSNQHVQSFSRRGGGYRMGQKHQVRCTTNLNIPKLYIRSYIGWEQGVGKPIDGHPLTAHLDGPRWFSKEVAAHHTWARFCTWPACRNFSPAMPRASGPAWSCPVGRCWHCGSGMGRLSVLCSSWADSPGWAQQHGNVALQ